VSRRITRSQFLRGDFEGTRIFLAPPWAPDRETFLATCTRCTACISACPEKIITPTQTGYPTIDFNRGYCTFCGACARACRDEVLNLQISPPWKLKAQITKSCLSKNGVLCRACTEQCEAGAIRFLQHPGPRWETLVDPDRCTGCGACREVCPAGAISLTRTQPYPENGSQEVTRR